MSDVTPEMPVMKQWERAVEELAVRESTSPVSRLADTEYDDLEGMIEGEQEVASIEPVVERPNRAADMGLYL